MSSMSKILKEKVNGFHELSDSKVNMNELKIYIKMFNAFKSSIKNELNINVKVSDHFIMRIAASFDRDKAASILRIFESVVLKNIINWEIENKTVWDNRQELKDIYESFFIVFKFHGPKNVDFISVGIPGERDSNRKKGTFGMSNTQKKVHYSKCG